MNKIKAKYLIETPFPLEKAAEVLAGEQSSGTFVAVPGETAALKKRFAAQVQSITPLETVEAPSLPGLVSNGRRYQRALIEVDWPVDNVGFNLPTLVSTLQGNLYELSQFTGLKLMDIDIPEVFSDHYRGPAFGIKGCRQLTAVEEGRPLVGTIIKPSIGLAPEDTAAEWRTFRAFWRTGAARH
jgi:ribulose-bisphosphate carboxylase large chain